MNLPHVSSELKNIQDDHYSLLSSVRDPQCRDIKFLLLCLLDFAHVLPDPNHTSLLSLVITLPPSPVVLGLGWMAGYPGPGEPCAFHALVDSWEKVQRPFHFCVAFR